MPFIHEVVVAEADIDNLGHASNLVYLRWVQEAALAHSTALGFPETAYLARGQAWVVRTHEIEYLRAAVLGDRLRIETRVVTMKVANSLRKTEISRAAGRCASLTTCERPSRSNRSRPYDKGLMRPCTTRPEIGRSSITCTIHSPLRTHPHPLFTTRPQAAPKNPQTPHRDVSRSCALPRFSQPVIPSGYSQETMA